MTIKDLREKQDVANAWSIDKPPDHGFMRSVKEWSQNTTFHGVRFISDSTAPLRRIMWLLLVLGCLAAVIFQIVDRVNYFYSWPITVNVEINYNQSMKFPTITICNQNAFRGSEAARTGRYRLVEEMFVSKDPLTAEDLDRHNATNTSLNELYADLAHAKEDMIVSCSWKNTPCTAEDFKPVLTDHGQCYTFTRDQTDMIMTSSGVDAGLRLTLNVEQYEYMAGPHDAAGLKILLHDSREMPFVHELGQAVPTGTHAFFGVKFMSIDNLPDPHGDCAEKALRHTTYYTTEECYLDCLTTHAQGKYSPPICTIQQYYECLQGVYDLIMQIEFSLDIQANKTNEIFTSMEDAYQTKERIYRYQEYAIEKNFLRAREAMEERTLANIANAFAEFAMTNVKRIRRLANSTSDDHDRKDLYESIIDGLKTRQEIAELARANVTLLISSYIFGEPIFNYKFETLPRSHNQYIVPKPLMNDSMHYNSYVQKYVPKLKVADFDLMYKVLEMFMNQTKIAYEDRLHSLVSMLREYTDEHTVGLMDLATEFSSNQTKHLTNNLTMFYQEVQTRGQEVIDLLSFIENPIHSMWALILNDEDSWDYYNFTGNTLFMRNSSLVDTEWESKVSAAKSYDIRDHIGHKSEDFNSAFKNLASRLESFKTSIEIDGNFLRENFLQVDIFYRQLSYEHINQQKAYDFFALICDVGGAMGLFIGGSMLTVLEVIDLFLIQLPIFKHKTKNKQNTILSYPLPKERI
ncbi:acid-sensing ion channel 5-like [Mya arenaria]|uniref:acid-sensing ion channel 5-like n=1 Tax=Mya arenaria TaxID=6604 RepID=UPI0022E4B2AF|nr:acid-sensing ion channel 5-like [Mya arenaria]